MLDDADLYYGQIKQKNVIYDSICDDATRRPEP